MKSKLSFIICCLTLITSSCTKQSNTQWVLDLRQKNPLMDCANYTSVYFQFDTIINNFKVSGIIYPKYYESYGWDANENGVRLFFYSQKTDKEYIWTNWNDNSRCFESYFMSQNVANIINDEHFNGFENGDAYVFHYNTAFNSTSAHSLLTNVEYQFYDVDFDGEQELIIGYYTGRPSTSPCFEIYELTDSGFVRKKVEHEDYFYVGNRANFDSENKIITDTVYDGPYAWDEHVYHADRKGDLYRLYYASFVSDFEHNIVTADTTFFR